MLVRNWESINLNPTVMIYKNDESYQLSIIYLNEVTKQLSSSTYELQEGEQGYFVYLNGKRALITYCQKLDMLTINEFWIFSTINIRKSAYFLRL
ncbi:DUF3876 domain-containing protein [Bacteroides thetaiotaomicron]|uniref:DUF3876 domain-containing protein n=1 Tax=Bacteroides thetaiotaomicron TaxID=818 RepID=UPI00189B5267|nr:DUF3876 domain-containing protein [Bacteroides thetaiotaomicron]MBV3109759.1 DUF3876 domain-containing protein [Bacteroides thetaiotaomicron]MBV3136829.1 DUF3876 domain-containing protein [Bacteroides thetaiotaomicron]